VRPKPVKVVFYLSFLKEDARGEPGNMVCNLLYVIGRSQSIARKWCSAVCYLLFFTGGGQIRAGNVVCYLLFVTGGSQSRARKCREGSCPGYDIERRVCNTFSCHGSTEKIIKTQKHQYI
jgi:hypothetical protein